MADNDVILMPEILQGVLFNACSDSCDFIQGPCACGALHHLEDWNKEIQEIVKRTTYVSE